MGPVSGHYRLCDHVYFAAGMLFTAKDSLQIVAIVSRRLLITLHSQIHVVLVDPTFTVVLSVKVNEDERLAELDVILGFQLH